MRQKVGRGQIVNLWISELFGWLFVFKVSEGDWVALNRCVGPAGVGMTTLAALGGG